MTRDSTHVTPTSIRRVDSILFPISIETRQPNMAAPPVSAVNFVTTWTMHDPPYAILKWRIENFSFARNRVESCRFDVTQSCRWYLLLDPDVPDDEDRFVEFHLALDPATRPPLRLLVRGEFTVHGPQNQLLYDRTFEQVYDEESISFRMPRVCFSLGSEGGDEYLVRCEMVVSREKVVSDEWQPHLEKLSADFEGLYQQHRFTDTVLRTSDGPIEVHRAVLSTRSAAALADPHHSIPSPVFTAVLLFVYTGNPDLLLDLVPLETLGGVAVLAALWKVDELQNVLTPVKIACRTRILCQYFLHTWQLRDFSRLPDEALSEEFVPDGETRWRLALQKRGDLYQMRLAKRQGGGGRIHVADVELRVYQRGGPHEVAKRRQAVHFPPQGAIDVPLLVTEAFLRSRILRDDALFIDCKLRFLPGTESRIESRENFVAQPKDDNTTLKYLKTLSRNFRDLFESGRCSDITLLSDRETLKAHRAVLWARSPYFRERLCHASSEFLSVPVGDPATLREVLLYVYSAELPAFSCANCLRFYRASRLLGLEQLWAACRRFVLRNLNVDIVLDVLEMVRELPDLELENAAVDFLCVRGNARRVIDTDRWMTFRQNYVDIAFRIYHRLTREYCHHVCIR